LAAAACSAQSGGPYFGRVPEPDPRHFTWCNLGDPESLDPARASSATDLKVVYELFDGLTSFDRAALPEPSLATAWEVAPDLRRVTFHLRDARWSNGRPIVAGDFVYSIARVLHPLTASVNAAALWRLRHGKAYNTGTARVVLTDHAPLHAGEAVVTTDRDAFPGPNLRVARAPTPLRDSADPAAAVWAVAPAGTALTIIECADVPACAWAYVFDPGGDGVYGWVATAGLDAPNADRPYHVHGLDRDAEAVLPGRELLMLPDVLGAHAPDAHTLVLETEGPMPFLVDLTLQRAFRPVPREAVSRWPRTWTRPEHIVTSGPFHLVEWRPRDKLELVRAPTFWDAARVRLGRVTVLSMDEQSANANVYYQGGCDAVVANAVPPAYLPALAEKNDYHRSAYLSVSYYLINAERFPNVHFRRALAHALDRSRLPFLLKGGQDPAEQYVPGTPIARLSETELERCGVARDAPGVALFVGAAGHELCYRPPLGPRFDLDAARRELAAARAELGDATPRALTIRYNSGVEQNKVIAEWVQAEWQRVLGLAVTLEAQDWKTYLKATAARDYDVARMALAGNFADPEAEFVNIFRCDAPDNRAGFCDPEFDRLFAAAEHEPDRAARLELVRRAEARMIDAAPIIPMYVYTQHTLQKPYVRDLYMNLTDHQSLRATWIDAAWSAR
jgi:oligopeptide transport system substrate-binding protein